MGASIKARARLAVKPQTKARTLKLFWRKFQTDLAVVEADSEQYGVFRK